MVHFACFDTVSARSCHLICAFMDICFQVDLPRSDKNRIGPVHVNLNAVSFFGLWTQSQTEWTSLHHCIQRLYFALYKYPRLYRLWRTYCTVLLTSAVL